MTEQRNLLTSGLALTLRNWPAFVWTYVFNLGTAMLFTLPLRTQLSNITAHSLASQSLTTGFDLSSMVGVILKLSKGPGAATLSSHFTTPVFVAIYFLIVPGTLLCYQSGVRPRLATLFHAGFTYFWRFIRITLVNLVISGLIVGGLTALQNLWATHVDNTMVGRKSFLLELIGVIVIALVAAALRLYFDLVEVYTVQLGIQVLPEGSETTPKHQRQIRRTIKPAWRALAGNFFRSYVTFVFIAALGLGAVVITARTAMHSLGQPHVWPLFLLAQTGLFLMLFTRFWQRGVETVLALDNPLPLPVILVPEPTVPAPLDPQSIEDAGYNPIVVETIVVEEPTPERPTSETIPAQSSHPAKEGTTEVKQDFEI